MKDNSVESEVTGSHIIEVIVGIKLRFGRLARAWSDAPASSRRRCHRVLASVWALGLRSAPVEAQIGLHKLHQRLKLSVPIQGVPRR
jgi:hypothetical protein